MLSTTLNKNISSTIKLYLMLFASFFYYGCNNNQNPQIFTDPEKKVAELLMEKHGVMIADYGHHNSAPYYSLLKMLNEWFNLAITLSGDHSLTLIVEHDSIYTNKISYFLENGNIDSVIDLTYSYGTLEDIEFYNNLRKYKQKLNIFKNKKISFVVKGFEQVFNDSLYSLSQKDSDLWFVKVRDSITASGIINYMNTNQGNNILIFYGGGHLQNGYVEKQTPGLTYSESLGYYLAYYLKKEFGEGRILTIDQAIVDTNQFFFTPLEKYRNINILLESRFIPEGTRWERLEPDKYDMHILRHDVFIQQPHRINFMFSRKCIEHAIKRLGELENLLTGYDAKKEYDEIMEKLFIITGQKFTNIEELKSWYDKNSFIGLKRIKRVEFADQLFHYWQANLGNRKAQKLLNELGFGAGVFGEPIDTSEYKKTEEGAVEYWTYNNALSVYWLGYPDEKEEAKNILIQYSGQNFSNPEQYLEWGRKTDWLTDY